MKKYAFYWLAMAVVVITGCQKEKSFELGGAPGEGTLQSEATGDCLPKTVNGVYEAGKALVGNVNTISVSIDVTKTGTWSMTTDTVNGYFFKGTGRFTALGVNTVTLQSSGTPFADGINNFVVTYQGQVCDIQVDVLPAGAGGPAVFTLVSGGTPANCATAIVNGTYVKDVAVNSTNTVDVTVNVTTIGTYTLTATGGGLTFTKTAAFISTGNQTVRLNATGTATIAGPNTITFAAPFASCSFSVNVTAPVTGTLGGAPGTCTPVTPNGTYTQNIALTAANTIQIQITTASVGAYSVSTNTVAGISFSGTGTTTGATQTITLAGTGTPNANGPQLFTITYGTSTCTFTLPIAAPAGPAVYTIDCPNVDVNGTYQVGVNLTAANTIVLPITVTSAGSYSINASINGMTFTASGNLTLASTSITLVGNTANAPTGPAATYNLSVGAPACLIPIPVIAAPTIAWKFNVGATVYQGQTSLGDVVYDATSAAPLSFLDFYGDNTPGDEISFILIDLAGGVTGSEQYRSTSTGTINACAFYFTDGANTIDLMAQPADPTATPPTPAIGNMTFVVTSHTAATKTIVGTFSGTAHDVISNTSKTITNGTFTAVYQ